MLGPRLRRWLQPPKVVETMWTGFRTDADGIYVADYNVAAMLKEAAAVLRRREDIYKFKSYVAERLTVIQARIRPERDGQPVTVADGFDETVKHLEYMGNPISALGRADYVDRPMLRFRLKVLNDMIPVKGKKELAPDTYVPMLLEVGEELGLGKDRAMQHGKFDVVEYSKAE